MSETATLPTIAELLDEAQAARAAAAAKAEAEYQEAVARDRAEFRGLLAAVLGVAPQDVTLSPDGNATHAQVGELHFRSMPGYTPWHLALCAVCHQPDVIAGEVRSHNRRADLAQQLLDANGIRCDDCQQREAQAAERRQQLQKRPALPAAVKLTQLEAAARDLLQAIDAAGPIENLRVAQAVVALEGALELLRLPEPPQPTATEQLADVLRRLVNEAVEKLPGATLPAQLDD